MISRKFGVLLLCLCTVIGMAFAICYDQRDDVLDRVICDKSYNEYSLAEGYTKYMRYSNSYVSVLRCRIGNTSAVDAFQNGVYSYEDTRTLLTLLNVSGEESRDLLPFLAECFDYAVVTEFLGNAWKGDVWVNNVAVDLDTSVFYVGLGKYTHTYGLAVDEQTYGIFIVPVPTSVYRDCDVKVSYAKLVVSDTLSDVDMPSDIKPAIPERFEVYSAKPVVYLYPESNIQTYITLDIDGDLLCTYPKYNDIWDMYALEDGTLVDPYGQEYSYLYWEGTSPSAASFDTGFCVCGADTAAFLEEKLEELGLNRREANEFIVYWLPQMEGNPYNIITFDTSEYVKHNRLTVSPEPNTMLRVFMTWKPSESFVESAPDTITTPERDGFTVVEWGGCKVAP